MKIALPAISAILLAACDAPKPPPPPPEQRLPGIAEIQSPVNAPPPVDSVPFETGYKAGDAAGAAAAKTDPRPRKQRTPPDDGQLAVLALEAAGSDKNKGRKWQEGFISGYRDGFVRIVENKR